MAAKPPKSLKPSKQVKSDLTKQKFVDIALRLFAKKGYAETTMRDLAKEADVSLGSFYYYFSSKEEIINEYYNRTFIELEKGTLQICGVTTKFEKRLIQFIQLRFETFIPQRSLVVALSSVAVDPNSNLSPFTEGTKEIRLKTFDLIQNLIEGSDLKAHAKIERHLKSLLWYYLLALIFYWVFDSSEKTKKSFELNERLTPFIVKLIRASRLPFAGTVLNPIIKIMDDYLTEA